APGAIVAIAAAVVALGGVLGLHLRALLFLGPLRSEALGANARALLRHHAALFYVDVLAELHGEEADEVVLEAHRALELDRQRRGADVVQVDVAAVVLALDRVAELPTAPVLGHEERALEALDRAEELLGDA